MTVSWETVSELDNAGFNLYRAGTGAALPWLLAAAGLTVAAGAVLRRRLT